MHANFIFLLPSGRRSSAFPLSQPNIFRAFRRLVVVVVLELFPKLGSHQLLPVSDRCWDPEMTLGGGEDEDFRRETMAMDLEILCLLNSSPPGLIRQNL